MKNDIPTLKQLLINEIPPGFSRALYDRIWDIYPESFTAMFTDPLLGDEQANYVLGYYRRGLAETVFMNTAAEFGLSTKLVQPENGGCKHVYVSTGRFGFTMFHVPSRAGFPKHSDCREQSSKINAHIQQQSLFPIDSRPDKETIYGVFVHTEHIGKKDAFNSLSVGFPNPKFSDWVEEPIDIQDLIDIQQKRFQDQEDVYAESQHTDPVWKKTHKSEKEGEQ